VVATRWCPNCGSEWWNDAAACHDCGTLLVDEEPSEPERRDVVAGEAGHDIAELDLPQIDESGRWRLTAVLQVQHVMHRWNGTTLTLPAAAVSVVEDELAEMEGLGSGDDPTDRAPGGSSEEVSSATETNPVPRPPRLARCAAAVLDGVVFVAIGFALNAFRVYQEMSATTGQVVRTARPSAGAAVTFAVLVVGSATATVHLVGRTPGMALAGVRVTTTDGRRLSIARSLCRSVLALGWLVSPPLLVAVGIPVSLRTLGLLQAVAGLWFFLLLGTIVGDPEGRGVHDRLAGSITRAVPRRVRPASPTFRL
jgi:uncharacterized RDD family membrane protein YckC